MQTLNVPRNFSQINLSRFFNIDTAYAAFLIFGFAVILAGVAAIAGAFDSPNERVTGAIAKSQIPAMVRAAGIVQLEGGSSTDTQRLFAKTSDGREWHWRGRSNDDKYKLLLENERVLYFGREPGDLESKDEYLSSIIKDLQIAKSHLDKYRLKEAEASATWR